MRRDRSESQRLFRRLREAVEKAVENLRGCLMITAGGTIIN